MKRHGEKRYSSGKPNPGEHRGYKKVQKNNYDEPDFSWILVVIGIVVVGLILFLASKV